MEKASYKYEVIHETLISSPGVFNVSVLCELAGVSRSGYYAWKKAAPAREEREAQDRADFELILTIYKKRGYAKGARSIYMGLLHLSPPVIMNIKKIRRLMKKYGLFCPIRKANPYRRMAKALKTSNYADNILKREFECYGPRYVLLTDITYIPYNGTFAYLSTILDAYTKQILAYVVSDSLEVAFVKETVEILVRDHGVSLHKETLIHSDYTEKKITPRSIWKVLILCAFHTRLLGVIFLFYLVIAAIFLRISGSSHFFFFPSSRVLSAFSRDSFSML